MVLQPASTTPEPTNLDLVVEEDGDLDLAGAGIAVLALAFSSRGFPVGRRPGEEADETNIT